MLVVDCDPRRVTGQLAAGELACPCGGRVSRWGFAGSRTVRTRAGVRPVRLQRVRCRGCAATHVLLPSSLMARRRDAVEVIGDALHRAALGEGHRRIAARLKRPPDTVRGWLRAAREARAPVHACATPLADTVELLALTVSAWRLRFGPERANVWERAQRLTGGLLSMTPRTPPSLSAVVPPARLDR